MEKEPFPLSYSTISQHQLLDTELQKSISEKSNQYEARTIEDQVVQYARGTDRMIIPESLRPAILAFYHETLIHPGMTRMYQTMKMHLQWPGLKSDIENFVASCKTCQIWKKNTNAYGKLPVKDPIAEPWHTVQIDTIGPYSQSENVSSKKYYAITMIDPVTGWFEIFDNTTKSSKETARGFDRVWLCRYPRPREVIFDQGGEFTGTEFQEMLQSYGITPRPITVQNPQGNSNLERIHQVVGNMIRTSTLNDESWTEVLQYVAWAIRSTVHTTNGATPGQLVFQRDMIFDTPFIPDWIYIRNRRLAQVQSDNARENAGRLEHEYQIGDYIRIMQNPKNLPKLATRALGPFKILQVKSNGTVIIQRGHYCERINIRRIQPFQS